LHKVHALNIMWGDDICLFHVMFPELNEWVFMKFGIKGVKEFAEN